MDGVKGTKIADYAAVVGALFGLVGEDPIAFGESSESQGSE